MPRKECFFFFYENDFQTLFVDNESSNYLEVISFFDAKFLKEAMKLKLIQLWRLIHGFWQIYLLVQNLLVINNFSKKKLNHEVGSSG